MNKYLASIFVSLVTILSLNGCCGPTDYAFDNVTLSDSRNEETLKIENPMTTFASNTPVIYGQATFINPNEGETTYILINYSRYIDDELEVVDASTKITQQGGLMVFEGKRPGFSWPTGTYVIDFEVNNIIYASQTFEVISTDDTLYSEKSEWISNTQTSKTVDSEHNPTTPTTTFPSNSEEIFLTIDATEKMPKNTSIKVEWQYLDNAQIIISQEQTISKNQSTHFTLDRTHNKNFLLSSGDWPSGSYKARIIVDNTFIKQVLFKVS